MCARKLWVVFFFLNGWVLPQLERDWTQQDSALTEFTTTI